MDNYLAKVIDELYEVSSAMTFSELQALAIEISKTNHVFVAGAGRSGIIASSFVNRLMHLGISSSKVGDITSPHSSKGDMLIICSGSGETASLISLAESALNKKINLSLITSNIESTISQMSNNIVKIPAVSKDNQEKNISIQPMGSLFEQMLMITLDSIVLSLMEILKEDSDMMYSRHADLE